MKSLTESILNTSNVGKDAMIRKWIEEKGIFNSFNYKIKDYTIIPDNGEIITIFLDSNEINNIPKEFRFADGNYDISFYVNSWTKHAKINSLSFLPKQCRSVYFDRVKTISIPGIELHITEDCTFTSVPQVTHGNITIICDKNINSLNGLIISNISDFKKIKTFFKGFNFLSIEEDQLPADLIKKYDEKWSFSYDDPVYYEKQDKSCCIPQKDINELFDFLNKKNNINIDMNTINTIELDFRKKKLFRNCYDQWLKAEI